MSVQSTVSLSVAAEVLCDKDGSDHFLSTVPSLVCLHKWTVMTTAVQLTVFLNVQCALAQQTHYQGKELDNLL